MTMLLTDRATETKPAGEVCPLCNCRGLPTGRWHGAHELRECCGILLSWPHASVEAYERLYTTPDAYHVDAQEQDGQLPSLQRDTEHLTAARSRLELLRQWAPPPATLCDVGCGTGAFVAAAQAFGYEASGCDPCEELVRFGRGIGRELFSGTWRDVMHTHAILCLHDVLEHLAEPLACLTHLRGMLRSGGLLVVEMPEYRAPHPAWQRHIRPWQHPCLYNRAAAEELFARARLRIEAFHRPLRGSIGKAAWYLARED